MYFILLIQPFQPFQKVEPKIFNKFLSLNIQMLFKCQQICKLIHISE
jgi:hypothetical protein